MIAMHAFALNKNAKVAIFNLFVLSLAGLSKISLRKADEKNNIKYSRVI